jgi:hypothetical protein
MLMFASDAIIFRYVKKRYPLDYRPSFEACGVRKYDLAANGTDPDGGRVYVPDTFLIHGDDRVGAVADTTAKLAEANINLTAAAATGAGSGRFGMILWVAAADYERAAKALGG